MKKVTIQFNNEEIRAYKVNGSYNLHEIKAKHVGKEMLLRHKDIEEAALLLEGDSYLNKFADVSILILFKARVLGCKRIDGRTKEAKELPWFSIEECLANFQ